MQIRDHHGFELTGATPFATEKYLQALDAYYIYAGDPIGALDAAIADSPAFTMAHALKAYLMLLGTDAATMAEGAHAYAVASRLPCNGREQGHLAALGSFVAGEIRAAARILEDVAVEHPRDLLALQVGQIADFLVGDSRMLRDRIARAMPAWSPDMPGYHAMLGLYAFGLEETGLYDRAEAAGRQAIDLEPRNGWAQHAVAHVLEMQDRRLEGMAWMRADLHAWSHESFFAVHNWWHLALFHLGLGDTPEVLRLYDGPIYGTPSTMAFDMVDAAALLWRLKLQDIDVGDRWHAVADAYATQPRGLYAFDDCHAMMTFVGAGREADARGLLDAMALAVHGPADNAGFTAEVGLPLARGLYAFGNGDYALTCDLLRDIRNKAARFGGSHAQRDLIDLTLIAAAGRAGETSLERALKAERSAMNPRKVTKLAA